MQNGKLRIGVIGVGHLGKHHARIYGQLATEQKGVELSAIVDVLPERATEIAAPHRAEILYGFPRHHWQGRCRESRRSDFGTCAPCIELLENGIDLLVEKPIAASIEESRKLIDAAARNNRILQVGHVERFNPVVRAATDVATQPQFFEIHRLAVFTLRSLDIDVVLDLMIHDLDVVLSLVDSPVAEVRAVGIPVLSQKADIANARVEFENGCVANLTASRVSFEKVRKLRFFQPSDYISVDYASQSGTMVSLRMGRVMERKLEPAVTEPLKLELEAFVSCIRQRTMPVVSGEDGLRALELAMKINEQIALRSK
jgi:predicted dehydrogenase